MVAMSVVINATTVPPIIRAITNAIIRRPIVRDRVRVIAVAVWIAVVAWESETDSYRNSGI